MSKFDELLDIDLFTFDLDKDVIKIPFRAEVPQPRPHLNVEPFPPRPKIERKVRGPRDNVDLRVQLLKMRYAKAEDELINITFDIKPQPAKEPEQTKNAPKGKKRPASDDLNEASAKKMMCQDDLDLGDKTLTTEELEYLMFGDD
ncbi:unnamed protein product [Bursaphelenchus okinawaensis]|uniref:Uncharacterized protein n=1 Tax=Bursaphelenchus okinawaensis TaxID=465554 RepID=A0A811JUV9_9BILA|nr:unnamed protein product [Bursaphelenchus okinawaensis]CAG9084731.1 unnamed protein product [Bursaphelenchus okinawaensis]